MKQLVTVISILGVFLTVVGVAYGDDELVFGANLSGRQEITGSGPVLPPQPGVTTSSNGRFRIEFNAAFSRAEFSLRVNNGNNILQAHLHCAPAGMNGPIIVFLFGPEQPPGNDVDGLLSEGRLTNNDFEANDCNPTCGKPVNNIASLRAAMLDGCIYANVHTVEHTGGEIRGQVVPVETE